MATSIATECNFKKGLLDPENDRPVDKREPLMSRRLLIGLFCFILVLIFTIVALLGMLLVERKQFEAQNDRVLATAHYELRNPRLEEDVTMPENIAAYTIQGYQMMEDSGVSVNLKNDGIFVITKNGTYTIVARLTLRDNQKNAGMGIYIDDTVCDKDVTTVPAITDPDSDTEYPSVVSLTVSCMDRQLHKGQLISIRLYYDRLILSGNADEYRALNWVHIQESSNVV